MNGSAGLSVCSSSRLPLAIQAAEKGYTASAPDSLGSCGRPADREARALKVERPCLLGEGEKNLLPFLRVMNNNGVDEVHVTNSDVRNAPFSLIRADLSVLGGDDVHEVKIRVSFVFIGCHKHRQRCVLVIMVHGMHLSVSNNHVQTG